MRQVHHSGSENDKVLPQCSLMSLWARAMSHACRRIQILVALAYLAPIDVVVLNAASTSAPAEAFELVVRLDGAGWNAGPVDVFVDYRHIGVLGAERTTLSKELSAGQHTLEVRWQHQVFKRSLRLDAGHSRHLELVQTTDMRSDRSAWFVVASVFAIVAIFGVCRVRAHGRKSNIGLVGQHARATTTLSNEERYLSDAPAYCCERKTAGLPHSGCTDGHRQTNARQCFDRGRALVIGIANYRHVSSLPEMVLKDASDVAQLLRSQDYCGYPSANVELLLDGSAAVESIRAGFRRLAEATGPNDTAFVYFSGHGGRVPSGGNAGSFLMPVDFNPSRLQDTTISSEELTTLLSAIKAKRLVVLLDACHAAGAGELKAFSPETDIKAGLDESTYNALANGAGRVIMASSRSNERSLVLPGMENSIFTYFLLEALKGEAGTRGDGVVRVFDVFHYVSDNVPTRATTQHPIFKAHDVESNFPLALCVGGKAGPVSSCLGSGERLAAARPSSLSGRCSLIIIKRLVSRWPDLATYFEIPLADQATFEKGQEPRRLLEWLDQRGRLGDIRDAFNFLGWDDLMKQLDLHLP